MQNRTAKAITNLVVHATILLVFFPVAVCATAQSGGDYDLSWSTIGGGGGTSSGGEYTLTGTIGQPEAGAMSGGEYEILGGFWPGEPLCIVEFDDFARFAEHWLDSSEGADLNKDQALDFLDVQMFTDYWLAYCPYGWTLR